MIHLNPIYLQRFSTTENIFLSSQFCYFASRTHNVNWSDERAERNVSALRHAELFWIAKRKSRKPENDSEPDFVPLKLHFDVSYRIATAYKLLISGKLFFCNFPRILSIIILVFKLLKFDLNFFPLKHFRNLGQWFTIQLKASLCSQNCYLTIKF